MIRHHFIANALQRRYARCAALGKIGAEILVKDVLIEIGHYHPICLTDAVTPYVIAQSDLGQTERVRFSDEMAHRGTGVFRQIL
jgi:hypothetical protein